MLIVWQEHRDIEIDAGVDMGTKTFSANGEYLLTGHYEGVRVWRVQDGKEMARLEMNVNSLAVSKDDNWIAGTTWEGDVIIWDANTYIQKYQWRTDSEIVFGLDFSSDATRLIVASDDITAIIWDLATGNEAQRLVHERAVYAAKYSPEGDRIATATWDEVRVWDSEDGRLLYDIQVAQCDIAGLVWGYNLLLVTAKDKVWKIKGTTVSEWSIPQRRGTSRTALQNHGEFVVSATRRGVRFWDISTHTERPPIQHSQNIQSITLSPDDQFIAITGKDGKITMKRLSHISVSIVPSCISTSLLCSSFGSFFYLFH